MARPGGAGGRDDESAILAGRRVVLGVSGGIAAYKAVELCRSLVDAGAHVAPVLTEDAQRFVGPTTFSALASEPVRSSLFDAPEPIPHTHLGQSADVVVVAPATAKVLGKYAAGISDDLLTATLLATRAPVVVAPAMHTEMWEHDAVQANVTTLQRRGVVVVPPETGALAGGDVGAGRLATTEAIIAGIVAALRSAPGRDLAGVRVLVSAGGTREPIDPVRYIGNRSSGRMGHAVAEAAERRGAAVTLVTAARLPSPPGVERIAVETAQEMFDALAARFDECDLLVMAAAVADFRPKEAADQKLKKGDGTPEIVLEPTPDILGALVPSRRHQIVVGFAAETENVREHAVAKLEAKGLDLIVANDVSAADSGFEVDTNRAVLLDPDGGAEALPLLGKRDLADVILDRVADRLPGAGTTESEGIE